MFIIDNCSNIHEHLQLPKKLHFNYIYVCNFLKKNMLSLTVVTRSETLLNILGLMEIDIIFL